MKAGISLKRVWDDNDVVELEVAASDGLSVFRNKVYVGHGALDETIERLDAFKRQVHGGLYDITFGSFGREYANGAFEARLHFFKPGTLAVTVKAESEWKPFKDKGEVASSATLHLTSEPALLDNFIEELKALVANLAKEASLWSA